MGQQTYDSNNAESYVPAAHLPDGLKWDKNQIESNGMLEKRGTIIVWAQRLSLDLKEAEAKKFTTLDNILEELEGLISTGKLFPSSLLHLGALLKFLTLH